MTVSPPQGRLAGGLRWSLVRTPDQKTLDDPNIAPVSKFSTGFLNASIDDLGAHFEKRAPDIREHPAFWNETTFGVLDQRSIEEKTILVAIPYLAQDREELRTECGGDEELMNAWIPSGWYKIRVSFQDAAFICSGIEHTGDM